MNKVNYDKLMLDKVQHVTADSTLLLHCCCAPCLTHSLYVMIEHFDNITVYYSNDNITDNAEWHKRYDEIVKLVDIVNSGNYIVTPRQPIQLVCKPLDSSDYLCRVTGNTTDREGGQRCHICYDMRLADSYQYASTHHYSHYATTLTVSPYKNCQWLNEIGLGYSSNSTQYLPTDFKKHDGYKHSIQLSNQYELYRQHYCGCPYSLQPQADEQA